MPQVLADAAPEQIAFLHIDMNNAEAERGALEVLFDRVSTGGIIVFDDYGWSGYRAQKDLADDFMQLHGLSVLELPTGGACCEAIMAADRVGALLPADQGIGFH